MFRKEFLMTPGPTPLPAEVLLTQAEPMMHHRTRPMPISSSRPCRVSRISS